jgi:hypothetical protein
LTILLGAACKDPVAPDPTYYGATPSRCIYYLELAFNDRDISIFEIQLAPDFTFYFNPNDIGSDVNGYIIPASWGYEYIRRAIWNMVRPYDEGGAYEITMSLAEGDIDDPPEGDTTHTASNIAINLLVMIDPDNGFIANYGTLMFVFEKTAHESEDYWRITEWREFTYSAKGTESSSLGKIFAYFYSIDPLDPTQ